MVNRVGAHQVGSFQEQCFFATCTEYLRNLIDRIQGYIQELWSKIVGWCCCPVVSAESLVNQSVSAPSIQQPQVLSSPVQSLVLRVSDLLHEIQQERSQLERLEAQLPRDWLNRWPLQLTWPHRDIGWELYHKVENVRERVERLDRALEELERFPEREQIEQQLNPLIMQFAPLPVWLQSCLRRREREQLVFAPTAWNNLMIDLEAWGQQLSQELREQLRREISHIPREGLQNEPKAEDWLQHLKSYLPQNLKNQLESWMQLPQIRRNHRAAPGLEIFYSPFVQFLIRREERGVQFAVSQSLQPLQQRRIAWESMLGSEQ